MSAVSSPRPLSSSLDAIEVILTLLDREPDTTLAALVDGLAGSARAVLPVDGGDPGPGGVTHLAGCLVPVLRGLGRPRVVLVSVRAGGGDAAEEADLAAWRALVSTPRADAYELLDWFVVTDAAILSMAELAGPPARWAG
jgi:hypothetical protein